ncbi:hypothetical protein TBLA_0A04130 [Henningerozyma blattae CBS 6284]|uniref:glucan endo-1,3-beta-D-glucosidase n=1 Tax=Henningerozyma blattae (strain ATCC 34711 / CBS 6284 / DSM 70876 / NBRC 10599 / NRRL Y-10934 / UCD 77-7) TaxID=1071380 RepID=I2GVQ7_HENB6|nr:hypothetical protein TBLA_0A04130 [Tetrapisispora blattae CBS 6284]CCH58209.1 hypothetical protein TBLA_0A04130 [Tetrapisispora blattae CBS 6284]
MVSEKEENNGNIFNYPLSVNSPIPEFTRIEHEITPPNHINSNNRAIQTNKFYRNIILGNQMGTVTTDPYSISFIKKKNLIGMCVHDVNSHCKELNVPRVSHSDFLVLTALEYKHPTNIYLLNTGINNMSIQVHIKKSATEFIWFPLVQGMGFITAMYYNIKPVIISKIGFKKFKHLPTPKYGIRKYELTLNNGSIWFLYVYVNGNLMFDLYIDNENHNLVANSIAKGCIFQLTTEDNDHFNSAAGKFITDCEITATRLTYGYQFCYKYSSYGNSTSGASTIYLLPHHTKNLKDEIESKIIKTCLKSKKGIPMKCYLGNNFEFQILDTTERAFNPFASLTLTKNYQNVSENEFLINKIMSECNKTDIPKETNRDSMYFSGRLIAKYCWILYCCHYILNNKELVNTYSLQIKTALELFRKNSQIYPLNYDVTWGGLVSSGKCGKDFENRYYKNHNLHYCYHIIAAAIVTHIEKINGNSVWYEENKEWVENLIRDYSNPNIKDRYFPVFRTFDWYYWRSHEKGIYKFEDAALDKVHYEDVNCALALKLWGMVTNNSNLENIGSLQLGLIEEVSKIYPNFKRNSLSDLTEIFSKDDIRCFLQTLNK